MLTRAIPGDPAAMIAGQRASQQTVDSIRRTLGLDRPLYEQYIRYMGDLLKGDLGISIRNQRPVTQDLKTYFPATLELTLAAMLLSSRDIIGGINWCQTIKNKAEEIPDLVEKGKSQFEGPEIRGKTLGVVGLGAIGVMVANDAAALGMPVIGYDPFISVDAAWKMSRSVYRADTLEGLLSKADYVSLHLPLNDNTKGLLNAEKLRFMKAGAKIINLARGGLVAEADVIEALGTGKLASYITDFPTAKLLACPNVIAIPHLGASTPEAEDNCAVMAAQQIMNYLESGAVKNSVNLPFCHLERNAPFRLAVVNRNIPNMVGQITTLLANEQINIMDLVNHHRDDFAYNIIDTEQKIPEEILAKLREIDGIIRVRAI